MKKLIRKFLKLWPAKFFGLVFIFLSTHGVHGAMVAPVQSTVQMTILGAWYGVEGVAQPSATDLAKLQAGMNQYGFIAVPADMDSYFGHAGPTLSIALAINGVRVNPDLKTSNGSDFVYPASLTGTPQANVALAAIKASFITAPTTSTAPTPAVTSNQITYGSTIQLLFPSISGAGLHSHPIKYQDANAQQQVTGNAYPSDAWVVLGAYGTAAGYQSGQPIPSGSVVRFQFPANPTTGYRGTGMLHHHLSTAITVPTLPSMLQVTAGILAQTGGTTIPCNNTGDNWTITTSDGQPWTTASTIMIQPQTGTPEAAYYLTAVTQTFDVRANAGPLFPGSDFQKIVGLGLTPASWQAVIPGTPATTLATPATSIVSPNQLMPTSSVSALAEIVVPTNFSTEAGVTENITIGSLNSALEVWCITLDAKQIARYDANSTASNPWVAMDAKDANGTLLAQPLKMISVSTDGIMCLLDNNGASWQYDWTKKIFNKMIAGQALSLECISVGNADNIWSADADSKKIMRYDSSKGWQVVPNISGIFVSAGSDDTVMVIDDAGTLYNYDGVDSWVRLPMTLDRVSVGDSSNIWGINDGMIYQYINNTWKQVMSPSSAPATGFIEVATDDVGNVFLIDNIHNIYENLAAVAAAPAQVVPPVVAATIDALAAGTAAAVTTATGTVVPTTTPAVGTKAARKKARKAAAKKASGSRAQAKKGGKIKVVKGQQNAKQNPNKKATKRPSKKALKKTATIASDGTTTAAAGNKKAARKAARKAALAAPVTAADESVATPAPISAI